MPPDDPAAVRLARGLERLRGLLGDAVAGEGTSLRAGPLALALVLTKTGLEVRLDGWVRVFALGGDADDDAAEIDSALDLVAAALVGDARVRVKTAGGRAHAWTLEVRRGAAWQTASTCGGRVLTPFVRRGEHLVAGDLARPAALRPADVPALPSAPWLGLGGFTTPAASERPAELPIDGELDLHNFSPKDVKKLVLEYLEQCRARGISSVRIVHGKGIGNLRRTVHALLDRHPHVERWRLGGHGEGSWGATLVDLRLPDSDAP